MTDQPPVPESAEVRRERARRLLRRVRDELALGELKGSEKPARSTETAVLRWLLLMPDELLDADPDNVGRKLRRVLSGEGLPVDLPDHLLEWWDSLLMAYVEGAPN